MLKDIAMENEVEVMPRVVIDHACKLGEGPVWLEGEQCILWLDILKCEIHSFYPATGAHKVFDTKVMVGAIAPRKAGGLIAALQDGLAIVNTKYDTIVHIAHPEKGMTGQRFNDGKCDPAGRFWAGSMAIDEHARAGKLYALETDFSVSAKIENTTISNGLAWTADHKTFYYIDTPTFEVVAYDYEMSTGNITNRRVAIHVPESAGYPDGMTIDAEGMLWIAHYNGWQVTRWNPRTGKMLHAIKLPVAKVTCCTFGGPTYEDLYITTASKEMSEQEHAEQPLAGSLFVIKNCGYKGVAPFEFNG